MLKINKGIHFNILTIFAIVFVCVYLYYTICDMKKIAVEVKKNSQDIANIITSLGTLTKDLGDLKKKSVAGVTTAGNAKFVVTPQVTAKEVLTPDEEVVAEDDEESIDTADVKILLSDIPDDEDDADNDAIDEVVAAETDNKESQIKSLGYEELKKYCKDNGLSTKGTKDVLIQRALAAL